MTYSVRMLVLAFILCLQGCIYPDIHGKVVEEGTGQAITGAIVLAQWTTTVGLNSHAAVKIEEVLTDNSGNFFISGVYSPFVDAPRLVIYKKGYVPWRNDMTFENPVLRDFPTWGNNKIYKLEKYKREYEESEILSFLELGIIEADFIKTPLFANAALELSKEASRKRELEKHVYYIKDFTKVIKSLQKGIYSYDDIRARVNGNYDIYELNWIIEQIENNNPDVTTVIINNGVNFLRKSVDTDGKAVHGSSSVFFVKD